MSLFGSITSSVLGTQAQSSKIAAISNNVANVNTTGFKRTTAEFETLVTSQSGSSAALSSGGVTATGRQEISQQGLIQSTGIPTDAAVSGAGMFVVSDKTDGSGSFFYTRAGSFRVDDRGNFVNAAGFVLQAWPLDAQGQLPGEIGNLNTTSSALLASLESVNINTLSGIASGTSNISVGLNLDASQTILQGAGDTIEIPVASTANDANGADDIIVPTATPNIIEQGDGLTVTTAGQNFTFTLGGIVVGGDITANDILGASTKDQLMTGATAGDTFTITTTKTGTNTFTFTPTNPTSANGEFRTLEGLAQAISEVNGLTARVNGNQLHIAPTDATEAMTFANGNNFSTTGIDLSATTVLGANAAGVAFSQAVNGDGITLTADNGDVRTFTYGAANDFTTLTGLAAAINGEGTFTMTLTGDQITAITHAGGNNITAISSSGTGGSNFAENLGIQGTNFLEALDGVAAGGIANTTAASNRFATLGGLRDLINATDDIGAILEDPTLNSSMTVFARDPLGQITFANFDDAAGGASDFIAEFGLDSVTTFGPAYDPLGVNADNMAGGQITPHFSRNIQVFDSLGTGHDFQLSFLKLGNNNWAVELFAVNSDIDTTRDDGLIASGTVVFNGDGSLRSVSDSLTTTINVSWLNGATSNSLTIDWGTAGQISGTEGATEIGQTDGLRQFDAAYNVEFVQQNGVAAGLLDSVVFDEEGFIIANFSNGETRNIFKIPLADFANPDGLTVLAGNVFSESQRSGDFNLKEPGTGGIGTLAVEALELADVEISDELAELIKTQSAFQASVRVFTTSDELLEDFVRSF